MSDQMYSQELTYKPLIVIRFYYDYNSMVNIYILHQLV